MQVTVIYNYEYFYGEADLHATADEVVRRCARLPPAGEGANIVVANEKGRLFDAAQPLREIPTLIMCGNKLTLLAENSDNLASVTAVSKTHPNNGMSRMINGRSKQRYCCTFNYAAKRDIIRVNRATCYGERTRLFIAPEDWRDFMDYEE